MAPILSILLYHLGPITDHVFQRFTPNSRPIFLHSSPAFFSFFRPSPSPVKIFPGNSGSPTFLFSNSRRSSITSSVIPSSRQFLSTSASQVPSVSLFRNCVNSLSQPIFIHRGRVFTEPDSSFPHCVRDLFHMYIQNSLFFSRPNIFLNIFLSSAFNFSNSYCINIYTKNFYFLLLILKLEWTAPPPPCGQRGASSAFDSTSGSYIN